MKFFSFTNMYFSGIHAGIQTAHAVHQMENEYRIRITPRAKEHAISHARECLRYIS